MILEILRRTPIWVFVLFFALLFLGYSQTRTRTLPLWRLFLLPVAMVGFSLYGFIAAFGANGAAVAGWTAALLAVCLPIAATGFPRGVTYSREARSFTVPGSWIPFAAIMAIFFSRYAVNVALAMNPAWRGAVPFAAAVGALYGLSSGFFVGRTLTILRSRRRAAST
jgi:hypothetical protein